MKRIVFAAVPAAVLGVPSAAGAFKEDLVFKAAPPIVGGREFVQSGDKLEEGAKPASVNNFQGRYAIRHRWTGPVACKLEPVKPTK